jgi:hypothetical protein
MDMFINRIISLIVLLFFFGTIFAQRHEIGTKAGVTNYFGDLNHELRIEPNLGFVQLLYKNNQTKFYSFGFSLSIGQFSSSDANSINAWQVNRNASFSTSVNEIATFLEFNFLPTDKSGKKNFASPFFKVGTGVFTKTVYSQFRSDGVQLSGLHTEAQTLNNGRPSGLSIFLMYGLGVKFGIGKHIGFGLDFSLRKTSSDYLDDVSTVYPDEDLLRRVYGEEADVTLEYVNTSLNQNLDMQGKQRGSNFKNDDYVFAGFFFTYTINNPKCPLVVE